MKTLSLLKRLPLVAMLVVASLPSCAKDTGPAEPPVWNGVAHQAEAAGVKPACLQRVHNLSQFLVGGGQANGLIYYDPDHAASNLFSAVLGRQGQDGIHLAMMSVAPDDNCSATYEVVKVWANTCPQVVQAAYPGYQVKAELAGGTTVFELNPDEHLYAMTAPGNGCVTIQKGMVFKPVDSR